MRIAFLSQGGKLRNVLRQQDGTGVFVHDVAQFFVGNQQTGRSVLHHEIEAVFGITRVERLISAAGLEDAQRSHHHPLTTRNEDGDDGLLT